MRQGKSLADFDDLARALGRPKIDGRANCGCPHIASLLYGSEQDLIELVGETHVVIDFDDERNPMRILSRYHAKHAEGLCDRIAAAFDG